MSEVTDQPALSLVEDIIREKIFHHTDEEIPYVVKQVCQLKVISGFLLYFLYFRKT